MLYTAFLFSMSVSDKFSYKIYYKDTDAGGVLYYARYLDFLEKARTDFFDQSAILSKTLHEQGIFLAVRKAECNYLKPVFYGDTITVQVSLRNVKKTNFIVDYEIFNESVHVFSGYTLLVCVNSEFKISKIPDELNKFIEDFIKNA